MGLVGATLHKEAVTLKNITPLHQVVFAILLLGLGGCGDDFHSKIIEKQKNQNEQNEQIEPEQPNKKFSWSITQPTDKAKVWGETTFGFEVVDSEYEYVEFYLDALLLGRVTSPNTQLNHDLSQYNPGDYTLTAKLYRHNQASEDKSLSITLENPNPIKVVTSGLEAAYSFDEAQGSRVRDLIGNHDGQLSQKATWISGGVKHGSTSHTDISRGSLLSSSWTLEFWFQAKNHGEHGAGRAFSAASRVGGEGPELLFRSNRMGFRINGSDAVFNPPEIGSRSNSSPPDHWANCSETFSFQKIYHFVMVHNAANKKVTVYQTREGSGPVRLVFSGTYTGRYRASHSTIRLSNANGSFSRYVETTFYQMLIYSRPLSLTEIQKNFDLGKGSLNP